MSHDLQSEMQEKALLAQLIVGRTNRAVAEDSLAELERLADTAGAAVVGSLTQRRQRPTSSFFFTGSQTPPP